MPEGIPLRIRILTVSLHYERLKMITPKPPLPQEPFSILRQKKLIRRCKKTFLEKIEEKHDLGG